MSTVIKREIPMILTFIVGVLTVTNYYISEPTFNSAMSWTTNAILTIATFAVIIGVGSLTITHGSRTMKGEKDWINSLSLLAIMWLIIIIGFTYGPTNDVYQWFYNNVLLPLDATILSLIGFFVVTASYRSFVARSDEAALLLVAAILTIIGQAPIGGTIWPGFVTITDWLMNIPTTAGMRGFVIGVAIGTVSLGVRVLLGLERTYLGGD